MNDMRLRKIAVFALACVALIAAGRAAAQGGASQSDRLPAAIISFAPDVRSITVEAVESGAAPINLTWQVVGLTDQNRLLLHALSQGQWLPLTDQSLPASGSARLIVSSTGDFTPPTYRLGVFDLQGNLLTQYIVTLPFDTSFTPPTTIEVFTAQTNGVEFVELGQNRSRIPITWRVRGRAATANLVFEQLLPDGRAISAELPRAIRWIPSAGQGVLAPILTSNDMTRVQLRMRVVDLRDGTVLAEAFLELPVTRDGATLPPPTPIPTAIPPLTTPTPVIIVSPTPSS
jgi:hypothetical protein